MKCRIIKNVTSNTYYCVLYLHRLRLYLQDVSEKCFQILVKKEKKKMLKLLIQKMLTNLNLCL